MEAKERSAHTSEEGTLDQERMAPPVPDGTEYLESMGRWVDDLLGDARMQKAADKRIADLVGETQAPEDPPPVEIPEPVEDGNDVFTRGADPDERTGRSG